MEHGPLTEIAYAHVLDYIRHHWPIPAVRCSSAQARGKAKDYAYWGAARYEIRLNCRGELTAVGVSRARSDRRSYRLAEQDTEELAEQLGAIVITSIGRLNEVDRRAVFRWVEERDA